MVVEIIYCGIGNNKVVEIDKGQEGKQRGQVGE